MPKYSFHPACLAFPNLTETELSALAEDIKERGLLNPIVLLDGKILDGKNRLAACKLAGIVPRFIEWEESGSPTEWVISTNLFRRHLNASQRAVVALGILPILETEAKERQRKGRGKVANSFATQNGKASEMAARIAKANSRYVEQVKAIQSEAPELIERIRDGQFSVPDAKRLVQMPKRDRVKVLSMANGTVLNRGDIDRLALEVRRGKRIRTIDAPPDENIFVGNLDLLWDKLDDNRVDLFFSDPPFSDMDAYSKLAELAAAKLKPGRLCLAYVGQFKLPEVLDRMREHLSYWWMFAIEHGGQHLAIHPRKVQNKWRAVVAFAKPPMKPAPEWLGDHLRGVGRDKEFHDWGQSQTEAEYLIDKLTAPKELVVDPFCGGGTIPCAAKSLGRRWMATEIDKGNAKQARQRLAEI